MFLKKLFDFIYTHRFLTFLVVFFCCLFLFSLDSKCYGISVSDSVFTDSDVSRARSLVGESIWNNNDYDIVLMYNMQNSYVGKMVYYFNCTNFNRNTYYFISNPYVKNNGYYTYEMSSGYYNNNQFTPNTGFYVTGKSLYGGYNVVNTSSNGYIENSEVNNSSVAYFKAIRSHFPFYNSSSGILLNPTTHFTYTPEIINSVNDIQNWSFDNLIIQGNIPMYYNFEDVLIQKDMTLYLKVGDYWSYMNVDNYFNGVKTLDYSNWTISIPKSDLFNNYFFPVNTDSDYIHLLNHKFVLGVGGISYGGQNIDSSHDTAQNYDLGTYNITLPVDVAKNINGQNDSNQKQQLINEQQETNDKLNDISSSINNSNISDITNDTLPSDSTQDITADGVNGIFTSIYNAFCTGTAQDIVFPIPFTNKSITLSPNYVSTMLSSVGATFVIRLIQAFWWYLISRFIVKDVMDKINKIKSGNIEKIEETNIRGDML